MPLAYGVRVQRLCDILHLDGAKAGERDMSDGFRTRLETEWSHL